MPQTYYLTTTAPYVNAKPHIGFALEIIQADVLARYHTALGDQVFFNTGTDEHGKKIYEKALEEKKDPQAYTDEYAAKFDDLKKALNLSYTSFQRTTNPDHIAAAQEMWRRVDAAGYIKKGIYKAKYCVGCELEKQDSDLVDGRCPLHPTKEIELIEEENYFFQFSKLADKLLAHYDTYPDFVIPPHRQKEIRNFVASGLTDFSISRIAEKMPWGVPVPGDDKHCMYVWFDALTYYISALGWPSSAEASAGKPSYMAEASAGKPSYMAEASAGKPSTMDNASAGKPSYMAEASAGKPSTMDNASAGKPTQFEEFWGTVEHPRAIQVAGKDNLRQQTAMWQAMLLAAGLPPTRQILIHGFITSGGQKMSKSLGNVIDPMEYVDTYGTDALRYYLLAKLDPFEDSDFTKEKFEEVYQADLANGLGNLVARVAAMAAKENLTVPLTQIDLDPQIAHELDEYHFDRAITRIWDTIKKADHYISENEVWKQSGDEKKSSLTKLVHDIRSIATNLAPFMPTTAAKICEQFCVEKIVKLAPLFPRLA